MSIETETAGAPETEDVLTSIANTRERLLGEIRKAIVGQESVVEDVLICLLSGGHALLTGVPGLGKTLLVKSIAQGLALGFKRIQFTPDLMPSDIFGTEIVEEDPATGKRSFKFIRGPVFANVVLADEINRTPPKTQAALLEAMGEGQVTAAGQTFILEAPFFVLATQNPIELEGTYPLPEAQLDRFLLNSVMDYLPEAEERRMVQQTTSTPGAPLEAVLTREEVLQAQRLVRQVPLSEHVAGYAVRLVRATRPTLAEAPLITREKLKWGAGSRASQALVLAGKARALLHGRHTVAIEDVRALAPAVLRHRVVPNFQAEAEGMRADAIISEILSTVTEQ
jgi:MoxR-like ATPase